MKNIFKSKMLIRIYSFVLIVSVAYIVAAQDDSRNEKLSTKFVNSFIKLHPDTVAYPTEAKSYRWNYEQGLILEAIYRVYKSTGEKEYYDYIKKNIDYYIQDDGSIITYRMTDFNIDNVSPGRVLLHLFKETKNEKYKKAADSLKYQMSIHPRTNEGGFWHKKIYPYQMWLDGLYMAEPFLAMYGKKFNEPGIFDDVAQQFSLIHKYLKDDNTGLYYHAYDESKQMPWADKMTGKSPNFWGRAMGWFMMALVDVLDYLPDDHKGRDEIKLILSNLTESLVKFRSAETKLWYQVTDQGSREGNYTEASASMMYIYSIAKAANKGYIDKKYFNIADESFNSAMKSLVKINEDGAVYLNNVVSVGGLGGNPYRDGSFEYYISEPIRVNDFKGYGPLILAALEIEKGNND